MRGGGGGESTATWGRISVDRGSKATLPRTIPCREFKSSAKNSTDYSFETAIKGIHASHVQNSCGGNCNVPKVVCESVAKKGFLVQVGVHGLGHGRVQGRVWLVIFWPFSTREGHGQKHGRMTRACHPTRACANPCPYLCPDGSCLFPWRLCVTRPRTQVCRGIRHGRVRSDTGVSWPVCVSQFDDHAWIEAHGLGHGRVSSRVWPRSREFCADPSHSFPLI
ncbi:hypothetical protein KSP40_PGU006168 [Platanthera guangdongensis]|uniref:Uncharacterized protein n=1 Tax=Platanthera guangdongensis TaxID=2320717 RepID=A0ABR2LZ28_9ASPA